MTQWQLNYIYHGLFISSALIKLEYLQWYHISFVELCLNFSIPNNHCQQVVRQLGKSHAQSWKHQMKLSARYCVNFELITFSDNFRKGLCWKHCKYEMSVFFLRSSGMNRITEQKITREPLPGSHNLFVLALIHSQWTQETRGPRAFYRSPDNQQQIVQSGFK